MSNIITGKVLAIQLGREETRIVLLGNGSEILHAVAMPTTAGAVDDGVIRNPEAVRAMLKKALEEPEFKRVRQAVFTLCTSQIITETVTTPDLPASKLEKLLRSNADMYFPVDTQEYNLVWQVIGPKQGEGGLKELSVQLWAVPNAMLQPYYSVANACGLSVAAIDYCGHGIATAAGASFSAAVKTGKKGKQHVEDAAALARARDGETKLHLLLEQDLLGMTFVKGNQVVMQRIIRCGSDPTYQFSELAMMLEYYRSMEGGWDNTITGIASGCHARDRQLVAELADMLGIPVAVMDAGYDMGLVLCVGAARTELDFGIATLNVAGKARKEVKSQLWQYLLLLGCGVVLVGVILFTLSAQLTWNTRISGLENESQTLTIQYAQVSEYSKNYDNYDQLYNAYSNDWETIFTNLQTYNNNLVLAMEELEDLLPDNASVVGMEIGASGLNVTFATETKEEAAYLIMALRDMKYADVMAISPLQGGGNGPAESYGSAAAEQAPAEGSSSQELTAEQWDAMNEALTADLNAYAVAYHLGMGTNVTDRIGELEQAYPLQLTNQYDTLADLQKAVGAELTYEVRSNAFTAMCTTNPFAMNAAESMLYRDYLTGGSLGPYIERQLELRDSSIISVYRHRSVADLQGDIELLVDIMTTYDSSYDALSAAEKVICGNEEMEDWYVYYLEAELKELESAVELPYLDMNSVISDVLDGAFNSNFSGLNGVLNSLLSAQTKSVIKRVNNELNPTEPGTTEPPTEPGDVTQPTVPVDPTGPGGDDATTDLFLEMVLKTYMQYGHLVPGSEEYIDNIVLYFETGSSGTELDPILDSFINSGKSDEIMKALLELYEENPDAIENETMRKLIENYLENGTTGNEVLDDWIERCKNALEEILPTEPSKPTDPADPSSPSDPTDPTKPSEPSQPEIDAPDDTLKGWLMMFLYYGTTGEKDDANNNKVPDADELIAMYLLSSSGMEDQDVRKKLDAVVANGDVDQFLVRQLHNYLYNKSAVPNATIVTMFDNYYKGTTGNAILDQRIKLAREQVAADALNAALNKGSGGGGQQAAPADKRIFFAVVLNYNEDLKNEELNRKGLYYDDKIERLEVDE